MPVFNKRKSVEESRPLKRHFRIQMFEDNWQVEEYHYNYLKFKVLYEIKKLFYKIFLLRKTTQLEERNLQYYTERA